MLHPDNLPAPAPPSLLARAIFELSSIGVRITPLSVSCWLTDAGATDAEVRRALDQLAAATSTVEAA